MEYRNGIKKTIGDSKSMKEMESFLMMFYILDQCYWRYQEYELGDLGGFLGSISPEIWEDAYPIDMAKYIDWKKMNPPDTVNSQNIVKKIYKFLHVYEKEYGYRFGETKECLSKIELEDVLDNIYEKVQKMYEKYKFSD